MRERCEPDQCECGERYPCLAESTCRARWQTERERGPLLWEGDQA